MVSPENLRQLSLGGGTYIVCMPIYQGGEVAQEVLARPGRYQTVAENLKVKQVVVVEGERRRARPPGYLAHHPRRSQADQIGAIVELPRHRMAGHRPSSERTQPSEIPQDQEPTRGPPPRLTAYIHPLLRAFA
jgi:hypothetical protein